MQPLPAPDKRTEYEIDVEYDPQTIFTDGKGHRHTASYTWRLRMTTTDGELWESDPMPLAPDVDTREAASITARTLALLTIARIEGAFAEAIPGERGRPAPEAEAHQQAEGSSGS